MRPAPARWLRAALFFAIVCTGVLSAQVSVYRWGNKPPLNNGSSITYYYEYGQLYEDGSFTGSQGSSLILTSASYAASYASFYSWAVGKYVVMNNTFPDFPTWITVTGTHADPLFSSDTCYSVEIKGRATPTPTPPPTPTPVPNLDGRGYAWSSFGFPSDLNWRRLWDSPSSHAGFIDRLAFNLWNRGYPKTADALADDYQLLYSTINGMGVTIKKHRPKSAIKKWKKKLSRLAGEEAGFYQNLVNVKNFLDGSEPLYDIEKPLQQFAGDMNLAFQRARHGKKPVVGSSSWSSPACPSFSSNPLQTLDSGTQEISLPVTITGGAPMRGFSVTLHVAMHGGDSVSFKLVSPWNQSWNFIPSFTGMVGSDGLFDVAATERLQRLDTDRDPAGTWQFQITYTPDNAQPADALVVRQALTFYPSSLW